MVAGVVGVSRDVTEWVTWLGQFLKNLKSREVGVALIDRRGYLTWVSEGFRTKLGLPRDEVEGRGLHELSPPGQAEAMKQDWSSFRRARSPAPYTRVRHLHCGSDSRDLRPFEVRVFPLTPFPFVDGLPRGVVTIKPVEEPMDE